jgi:TolA-binding protein
MEPALAPVPASRIAAVVGPMADTLQRTVRTARWAGAELLSGCACWPESAARRLRRVVTDDGRGCKTLALTCATAAGLLLGWAACAGSPAKPLPAAGERQQQWASKEEGVENGQATPPRLAREMAELRRRQEELEGEVARLERLSEEQAAELASSEEIRQQQQDRPRLQRALFSSGTTKPPLDSSTATGPLPLPHAPGTRTATGPSSAATPQAEDNDDDDDDDDDDEDDDDDSPAALVYSTPCGVAEQRPVAPVAAAAAAEQHPVSPLLLATSALVRAHVERAAGRS